MISSVFLNCNGYVIHRAKRISIGSWIRAGYWSVQHFMCSIVKLSMWNEKYKCDNKIKKCNELNCTKKNRKAFSSPSSVYNTNCFNFWHKFQLYAVCNASFTHAIHHHNGIVFSGIVYLHHFVWSRFKCIESINAPASFTTNAASFVNIDSPFVCLRICWTDWYSSE